jgi:carbon monoxide dehydrogenase subunit G
VIIKASFEIDAPADRVWPMLCDIVFVAACIPNAEITEIVDEMTYKAKVAVKGGSVAVRYGATIFVESFNEATYTATMRIHGNAIGGRGGVKASLVSQVVSCDGSTHVDLHSDAQISGIIAALGGRVVEGIARKTVAEFSANLAKLLWTKAARDHRRLSTR